MHTVHLNIVKNAVLSLKEEEDDIIDWATADKRLKDFPWTTEFKHSRIPRDMEKRFGYGKADDFNKFAFPAFHMLNNKNGCALPAWWSFFKIMQGEDGQKVVLTLSKKWHQGMPYCLKTEEILEQCVPIEDIKEHATVYRSVWFPSHCYDSLLYRENEHAVAITQDGETIVKLLDLLCVFVSDHAC